MAPLRKNTLAVFIIFAIFLAGCGQNTDDAALIAQQQEALAATVAAAPTFVRNTTAPTQPSATIASTAVPSRPAATKARVAQATQTIALPTTVIQLSPTAQESAVRSPTTQASPTSEQATTLIPSATAVPPTAEPPTVVPTTEPPTIAPQPSAGITTITFTELYSGASISGPVLSDKAKSLDSQKVVMLGYMAPPLKPDLDFFVLTKDPMVYCPFCNSAADWPFDIVFVRMANGTVPALVPTQSIRVTGTFSVGTQTDAATGFVSQVRVIADTVEVLQ